jgi:hypothetical protein
VDVKTNEAVLIDLAQRLGLSPDMNWQEQLNQRVPVVAISA